MFTLILFLFTAGPDEGFKRFEYRYETAQQCIDARDWWVANYPRARPKGYEAGWEMTTLPNCYDQRGVLVPRVGRTS